MKTTNILVTSIGGPVAQGILKGLSEMDNVTIIGADRRLMTAGNLFCDKNYKIPSFSQLDQYLDKLEELIKKESIDVLFPGHPSETELYYEYRERLDIPVALPTSPIYSDLLDKEAVYIKLKEFGLEKYIPGYVGFTKNKDFKNLKNKHFPNESHVIVKNVTGFGANGFAIVTTEDNYIDAVKKGKRKFFSTELYLKTTNDSKRIMMEKLDGDEYSVDIFVHNNEVVVTVPRKRTGVSNGLVLDGTVEKEDYLIEASRKIAGNLVENGFINLQFMDSGKGYKLTDINPRFCGSQVMSLGAGVNFPELFIDYAVLGKRTKPKPKWGTRMIRYRDSYFISPEDNIKETN